MLNELLGHRYDEVLLMVELKGDLWLVPGRERGSGRRVGGGRRVRAHHGRHHHRLRRAARPAAPHRVLAEHEVGQRWGETGGLFYSHANSHLESHVG